MVAAPPASPVARILFVGPERACHPICHGRMSIRGRRYRGIAQRDDRCQGSRRGCCRHLDGKSLSVVTGREVGFRGLGDMFEGFFFSTLVLSLFDEETGQRRWRMSVTYQYLLLHLPVNSVILRPRHTAGSETMRRVELGPDSHVRPLLLL